MGITKLHNDTKQHDRVSQHYSSQQRKMVDFKGIIWVIKWLFLKTYLLENFDLKAEEDFKQLQLLGLKKVGYNQISVTAKKHIFSYFPQQLGLILMHFASRGHFLEQFNFLHLGNEENCWHKKSSPAQSQPAQHFRIYSVAFYCFAAKQICSVCCKTRLQTDRLRTWTWICLPPFHDLFHDVVWHYFARINKTYPEKLSHLLLCSLGLYIQTCTRYSALRMPDVHVTHATRVVSPPCWFQNWQGKTSLTS